MSESYFKNSYKNTRKDGVGIIVYNCGFQMCNSGHNWGPAMRDHFLIHYVVSGNGTYTVNSKKYQISAGDSFIIYPNTLVSYEADEENPWEYYWVGFNGTESTIILNQTDFSIDSPIIHFEYGEEIKQSLLNIYNSHGMLEFNRIRMTGYLHILLSIYVENATKNLSNAQSNVYVDNAIRYISHNYSRKIDILDISRNVGVSRSNLFRAFMKYAFMSPNQYLTMYRISIACELLKTQKMSILQIANSVGYDDQLYFSRVFKKIKGVSPKNYLTNKNKKNELPTDERIENDKF